MLSFVRIFSGILLELLVGLFVSRKRAYRRCRETFDRKRARWLGEHRGAVAILQNGRLVGFEAPEDPARVRGGWREEFTFRFPVVPPAEEELDPREDDWELVCEPFLDTDSPEIVDRADRTLLTRGHSRSRVRWLRLFARGAMFWNLLWWEWIALGSEDVLLGWRMTLRVGTLFVLLLLFAVASATGDWALWVPFAVAAVMLQRATYRRIERFVLGL